MTAPARQPRAAHAIAVGMLASGAGALLTLALGSPSPAPAAAIAVAAGAAIGLGGAIALADRLARVFVSGGAPPPGGLAAGHRHDAPLSASDPLTAHATPPPASAPPDVLASLPAGTKPAGSSVGAVDSAPAIGGGDLCDTSALIDRRVVALARLGLLRAPVIVPRAVTLELERLCGSQEKLKRARGQRGLAAIEELTRVGALALVASHAAEGAVDRALITLCRERGARLVTTDDALARLATLEGIPVLSIASLAEALKLPGKPGDRLTLEIAKPGQSPGQGVGFLDCGTAVVVEGARERLGESALVEVTGARRTKSGQLLFARLVQPPPDPAAPG